MFAVMLMGHVLFELEERFCGTLWDVGRKKLKTNQDPALNELNLCESKRDSILKQFKNNHDDIKEKKTRSCLPKHFCAVFVHN